MYFRKNTLKKYDLQESHNHFKIKLKIYFCKLGPWSIITANTDILLGSLLIKQ